MYEEVALVSANSYWSWGWTEQAKVDTATRDIRVKAAKLGANAVILKSVGSEALSTTGVALGNGLYGGTLNKMRTLDGLAIYMPNAASGR